jgi:integrase
VPFGALLRAIDGYDGTLEVRSALQLLALTFTRPGELRLATWKEFDLDAGIWIIPAPHEDASAASRPAVAASHRHPERASTLTGQYELLLSYD